MPIIEPVTVYVWKFRGKNVAWGHASMSIGSLYISWWPRPDNRQGTSKLSDQIYRAPAFEDRTYQEDVIAEGMKEDHRIIIPPGLDTAAMKSSYGSMAGRLGFFGPPAPWETQVRNCSTVVAQTLKAGGGDEYASWWSQRSRLIWSPNNVRDYAMSIREGLRKANAK